MKGRTVNHHPSCATQSPGHVGPCDCKGIQTPIYAGPHDDPQGCVIHLTCADGGNPDAASEIVIHDLGQQGIFVEFYFGPGYLGERQYQMLLPLSQADRLREFGARVWREELGISLKPSISPRGEIRQLPQKETP